MDPSTVDRINRGEFLACELVHAHTCEVYALLHSWKMLVPALKVYIPVHVVPMLVLKSKELRKRPGELVVRCVKNIAKSCGFVALYSGVIRYLMCRVGRATGSSGRWTLSLCVLLGSFAVALETPRRRTELALFLLPRAIEALWSLLRKWRLVKAIQGGDKLLFAAATGLVLLFYQNEPQLLKTNYLSVTQFLFGEN